MPGPAGPSRRTVSGITDQPRASEIRYEATSRPARVPSGKSHSGTSRGPACIRTAVRFRPRRPHRIPVPRCLPTGCVHDDQFTSARIVADTESGGEASAINVGRRTRALVVGAGIRLTLRVFVLAVVVGGEQRFILHRKAFEHLGVDEVE